MVGGPLAKPWSEGNDRMRACVVYESMFGNTKAIAEAIGQGLRQHLPVDVLEVSAARTLGDDCDLLVIGGPTHAFSMSRPATRDDARSKQPLPMESQGEGIREWIEEHAATVSARVVTFDTRVRHPRLPGSAAKSAQKALRAHGWRPVAPPETFDVAGMTGPLLDGEVERAMRWGSGLGQATLAATGA